MNRIILLLFLSLIFSDGYAQCGRSAMNKAIEDYDIGRFEEAITKLESCLSEDGFNKQERVAAYRILSVSYLEIDRVENAYKYASELITIQPDFATRPEDPLRFQQLISDIRKGLIDRQITSVSKASESLAEAPATVIVIPEEKILNRGYNDITEVLADLPGFDITLGKGPTYSHIYQRGYRSVLTDRTLFLIDGVEENDLSSNHAFMSRQYPLSNIKRVEVIYGPTSTMYGANAFVGVVNLVTKEPEDMIRQGRKFGIQASGGYGTFNTRYFDVTAAAKYKNVSLTTSLRMFSSDEMDLSKYDTWNPALGDDAHYTDVMTVTNQTSIDNILNNYGNMEGVLYTTNTDNSIITPTQSAIDMARQWDTEAMDTTFTGKQINQYTNHSYDWAINSKLKVADFTLGFQTWFREEGNPMWYNTKHGGSRNGNVWVPQNTFLYLKYERYVTDNLFVTSFTRYKVHELTDNTLFVRLNSYDNSVYDTEDLLAGVRPFWRTTYFYRISKQLRSELRAVYTGTNFNIIGGMEFRSSFLQGNYITDSNPNPSEDGFPIEIAGGNHFNHTDIGVYLQSSYRFRDNLKMTLGGRVDYNQVRVTEGYGTVFNPRVALVYSPKKFIIKALYATAFKDASNFTKYATTSTRAKNNPDLEPEKVTNFELSVNYDDPDNQFLAGIAAYYSKYSDVVAAVSIVDATLGATTQFQNIGALRIGGIQANAEYRLNSKYSFFLNYSFSDPRNTKDAEGTNNKRVADIASHRVNMGVNAKLVDGLNTNLRLNYVGKRKTGEGTTADTSPLTSIPAYTILNGTISYTHKNLAGFTLQLVVNNILDKEYFHPGIRTADGNTYAPTLPQNSRNMSARLLYKF